MSGDFNSLVVELRRRNVVRVAGLYGVVGWLLAQVAVIMESAFALPSAFDATVIAALLLGFPVALFLAWAFELTPEGVRRSEPGEAPNPARARAKKSRLNAFIAIGLAAAAGLFFLGRTTAPPAAPVDREASIAVLPFTDMSTGGDQGYFADGIAEELLNLLSRASDLRVASRTSAFSFRDGTVPMREIGESLGVAHVLEGSVRTSGPTIRITAQLIDTDSDLHLWSGTYDRPLSASNIFEVQDEIASNIVRELEGRLLDRNDADTPTDNTEALTAYLKARAAAATRTVDGIEESIREGTKAVILDPGFARAHAQLAYSYTLARYYGEMERGEATELAEKHMAQAVALDPGDADVRLLRGWTTFARHDAPNPESEALFTSLVRDDPGNADAWRGLSMSLNGTKERREAIERAAELDPRSSIILINLANQAAEVGEVDYAVGVLKRILRVDPGSPVVLSQLAYLLRDRGDLMESHRVAMSAGDDPQSEEARRAVYFALGMWEEAERLGLARASVARAVAGGDWSEARRLTSLMPANDPYALPSHFITDTAEQLDVTLDENPGWKAFLLRDEPLRDFSTVGSALSYYRAARDRDPEVAALLRARLGEYFDAPYNARPASVTWNTLLARWHALNNRPFEMDEALEARLALGAPIVSARFQEFRPHEGREEVLALRARSEALAGKLRTEIRADLANPPEPWWEPGG